MAKVLKYKNKNNKCRLENNVKNISILFHTTIGIALICIILLSNIFQGLMFETHYINTILLIGVLGLVFCIRYIIHNEKIVWNNWYILICIGFMLAYSLSLFNAANTRSAILVLSKYLCILVVVVIVVNSKNHLPLDQWFLYGLFITGVGIAALGLDAIWGGKLIAFINNMVARGQVTDGYGFLFNMLTNGDRLASVFQYPNTTGSFLLASWLISCGLWIKAENEMIGTLIGIGSVMIVAAFVLTLSRGAYILAVIMLIICILLLPKENRLPYAINALGTSITAALFGLYFWPGAPGRSMGIVCWFYSIILASGVGYMITLVQHRLSSRQLLNTESDTEAKESVQIKNVFIWGYRLTVLFGLSALLLFWLWTEPISLNAKQDVNISRPFRLEQKGNYILNIKFSKPISDDMSQLYIKLNGQSLKDIMVGRNKNIFKTSMQDLKKLDNVNLPFTIEDDLLVNQKLIIDGTMGTLSNKIISANIQEKNSGKVVKNIKLSRKLLSETTVQNIYSMISPDSAIIRLNFYIDGLNIIKDYPFTGAGGGGWEHLYTTYQGHKYVSRDIHSSGLQLLVEVGLLGIILLIWLCMVIIKKYIDLWHHPDFNQTLLWIGAFTILAHSMIDFDFAYFSIQMIFWALLSFLDSPKPFTKLNQAEFRIESSILKKNHAVKMLLKNMQILSYISFIALIISTIYWPFRCNLATDYAEIYSIEATNNNAITAEQNIRKAIELDPLKAEYKVSLAKLLVLRSEITKASFEEGNLLVAQARVQSDYMYRVLENISDYYQMSSQWEAAFETENRITTIQPLDPLAWQYKGMMIQRAIDWYSTKENVGVKDKQIALWIERGLKIPEEMEIVSKGKWNSVTVNAELQTLLDKWAVFESEQK